MDDLDEITAKANDLMKDPLVKQLKVFENKIKEFKRFTDSYKIELERQLKEIIVRIRSSNGTNIDQRIDELKKYDDKNSSSPFEPKRLKKWYLCKYQELCLIKRLHIPFSTCDEKLMIFPSKEKIIDQIFAGRASIHFVYTSLANSEPLLDAMKHKSENASLLDGNPQLWYIKDGMHEFLVRKLT